jgi:hypothetical protein
MTAILSPETIFPVLNHDPQAVYNDIAESALCTLDDLERSGASLAANEPQRLAFFPYGYSNDSESETNNRRVEHARESFLIGVAIRTGYLDKLEDVLGADVPDDGPFRFRKVASFGGGAVLETIFFDQDGVLSDRSVSKVGTITGYAYSFVPGHY